MWSIQNKPPRIQVLDFNYNILNIVVNTELTLTYNDDNLHYNILNIVVNTELIITRPN